jgi:NAD+ synthase (glutamine-hydrolysing)
MNSNLSEFGFVRVGAASPELRVADVEYNTMQIISTIRNAAENNCHIVLFPEMSITGYTCGDLFYQPLLINKAAQALIEIAAATSETASTAIIGLPIVSDGRLFNCAALLSNGAIIGIVPKTFIPNSLEYYEERWFSSSNDKVSDFVEIGDYTVPFGADLLFEADSLPNYIIGMEICEDLWTVVPPSCNMALSGATIMMNMSSGSEWLGKANYRKQLVLSQSARTIAGYIYAGSGPGESTTDLVFSGHCMIAENGLLLSESKRFQYDSQLIISDIDVQRITVERLKNNSFSASKPTMNFRQVIFNLPINQGSDLKRSLNKTPFVPVDPSLKNESCSEIFSLQTTGLATRLRHLKSNKVVLGLSGGLDSTLALLVAVKTFEKLSLPPDGIHALSMPGFGTTLRTKSNAERLATLLGTTFKTIPIKNSVNQHFADIGHDPEIHDIVYENSQARERTQILMDYANQIGGLVIGTGDLSELALGWSTYNGDHISMYAVNSGVPKTLVKYIVEWVAVSEYTGEATSVLNDICATPISPELLPANEDGTIAQHTENEIGPYLLHDFFLYYAMRFHFPPKKVLFLAETAFKGEFERIEILKWLKVFYSRFFSQQFKRSCLPDGIKVGSVALSPRGDWRMPSDASAALWLKELENIDG